MNKTKLLLFLLAVCTCAQLVAQPQMSQQAIAETILQARLYLTGNGRPRNEAKAMELYQQCAAQGSAKAMNAIGILYNEGIGVVRDAKEAKAWFTKAGKADYAQGWYNLGMSYKDARGEEQDFAEAFRYFSKAAAMDDEQSVYAKGYMLYKGLGTTQNYAQAAAFFSRGAALGMPNSMYFLGLCYRNGYGVPADAEKAKYWLGKAAAKGYQMAAEELDSKDAENSNQAAKALAQQLKVAAGPQAANLNEYRQVAHSIPANAIEGVYEGHLIKYDWSGQHAIHSATLKLTIGYADGKLIGTWAENDSVQVPFQATLTRSALVFQNTQSSFTDHYSPFIPVAYDFENAKLQWLQKGENVYLYGNVQLFSPERNEPQKPLYVSLTKVAGKGGNSNLISFTNEDGGPLLPNSLAAYPNPFSNVITVEFALTDACEVQTQLMTIEGQVVYANTAKKLDKGNYILQLQPQELAAGTYMLKLQYGKQFKTVKVVKQ
jgi:TPR repeat protein